MNKLPLIFCFFICLISASLNAQPTEGGIYATPDEVSFADTVDTRQEVVLPDTLGNIIVADDIISPTDTLSADTVTTKKAFKPDANKAVWLGAVIPGYGQIINKKYWKLPIVYGGFVGCAFAITWNSQQYKTYNTAYYDIIDGDPTTNSHLALLRGNSIDLYGGEDGFANILKTGRDQYLRYRDLSILVTVIYYGLTILEAYVDAQLYDFDISPDLAMRVQPTLINNDMVNNNPVTPANTIGRNNAIGVQWSFRIK